MDNKYNGQERRKTTRVKVDFFVFYKVDMPSEADVWVGNKVIKARMLDLSEIGMGILTNYDIPVSTILSIRFFLMNPFADKQEQSRSIEITGEVRYNKLLENNEHRLGISFTQIAQEDKSAIVEFKKTAMNR